MMKKIIESLQEFLDEFEDNDCSGNKEECKKCGLNKILPGFYGEKGEPITICDVLCELTDRNYYKEGD